MRPVPLPLLDRWRAAVLAAGSRFGFLDEEEPLIDQGWMVGIAAKRWRFYVPGDVLLVAIWNGQAERYPTWCRTIKGPTVGYFYIQCQRWRYRSTNRAGEMFDDRTPVVLMEPPEGAVADSPLAPAALSYVTEAHARVMCRSPGKRE